MGAQGIGGYRGTSTVTATGDARPSEQTQTKTTPTPADAGWQAPPLRTRIDTTEVTPPPEATGIGPQVRDAAAALDALEQQLRGLQPRQREQVKALLKQSGEAVPPLLKPAVDAAKAAQASLDALTPQGDDPHPALAVLSTVNFEDRRWTNALDALDTKLAASDRAPAELNNAVNLRELFLTMYRSNDPLDASHAQLLINKAKDGGSVTQSELDYLGAQYAASKDQFTESGQRVMEQFLDQGYAPYFQPDPFVDEQGRLNLPDPALVPKDQQNPFYRYQWTQGPIHLGPATPASVMQGDLGDCYFMASLAAEIAKDPGFLDKLMTDNHDGTWTVHFHDRHLLGLVNHQKDVTVDSELPAGGRAYARGDPRVGILEKAFASWKGGYEAVGSGAWPNRALAALTGKGSHIDVLRLEGKEDLAREMGDALKNGQCLVATTWNPKAATGLVQNHAYTVLGMSEENGRTYVTVRNPWGWDPLKAGDGGVQKIPFEDFKKEFFTLFRG